MPGMTASSNKLHQLTTADVLRFMVAGIIIGLTIGLCFDVVVARVASKLPTPAVGAPR